MPGVVAGTYGDASFIPQITVDAYGRVISAGSNAFVVNAASISTGTLSTTVLPIIPVAKGGTNSPTTLVNNRMVVTSGGAIVEAPALTDGQIYIGQTGGAPMPANLTAGTNVTITNSAGGITINATSSSVTGSTLNSANFWVGDGGNTAQPVTMSGDATLSNSGAIVITAAAVGSNEITDSSIQTADLAPQAVTNAQLGDASVTFSKMQNINTGKLLGRSTASAGAIEELVVGSGLTLSNGSLSAVGGGGDFYASGSTAMTGALRSVLGSQGSPGVTFVGDTDTGLFSSGANTLSFATSGSERMTIGSTGNVGIGTTSPGQNLSVVSTLANGATAVQLENTDSTGASRVLVYGNWPAVGGPVSLEAYGSATTYGTEGAGNVRAPGGASLFWEGTGGPLSIATMASQPIRFYTNGDTSASERMRIDTTGNVGIGTTSPNAKVDVMGALALSYDGSNRATFTPVAGSG
ncbi:MAG: hypothetical protein AAB250_12835, partial [Bdellovibrionota bacterium]